MVTDIKLHLEKNKGFQDHYVRITSMNLHHQKSQTLPLASAELIKRACSVSESITHFKVFATTDPTLTMEQLIKTFVLVVKEHPSTRKKKTKT